MTRETIYILTKYLNFLEMKKSLFFMPLIAAMAFTSCTSDEPLIDGDNSFDGSYDGQAYMRVRIAMPDNAVTRADFVNGTAEEQAIKDIGLKFYNADGSFYGYGLPMGDVTVNATTPTEGNNVEGKVGEAVIVLQINSNAPKPTHVVAFANCGENWKMTPEPDIDQIDKTMTGVTNTYEDGKAYYAMTSSNYRVDNQGQVAFVQGYQTQVSPNSFKPTSEEALAEGVPVDIYVERLAAKVRVNKADGMTPDKITNGDYTLDFEIDGYALGGTNSESYYIKHIIDQWSATTLWNGWNAPTDHRCFWAADMNYTNLITTPPTLGYVSYDEVKNDLTSNVNKWIYSTENTQTSLLGEPKSTNDALLAPTRAGSDDLNRYLFQEFAYVIGHYTVRKNGVELTGADAPYLYEYAGKILPHDAMLQFMQNSIGNVLYVKTQEGDKAAVYTAIDMVDKGYLEIGSYGNDASLVCLELKSTVTDSELQQYYIKKQADTPETSDDTNADSDFVQVKSRADITPLLKQSAVQAYGFKYEANCANTGKGGYLAYFPVLIKHLNTTLPDAKYGEDSRGYYGVVRNHCYDITINSIKGLGIGIFNPDVKIIPKDKIKPLYLGATFNILSWRVVNQYVNL